jgi:hypothetical protein
MHDQMGIIRSCRSFSRTVVPTGIKFDIAREVDRTGWCRGDGVGQLGRAFRRPVEWSLSPPEFIWQPAGSLKAGCMTGRVLPSALS